MQIFITVALEHYKASYLVGLFIKVIILLFESVRILCLVHKSTEAQQFYSITCCVDKFEIQIPSEGKVMLFHCKGNFPIFLFTNTN